MCLAKSTLTLQPKMEMPTIGASAMLHNTLNNIFHHAKLMIWDRTLFRDNCVCKVVPRVITRLTSPSQDSFLLISEVYFRVETGGEVHVKS